LHLQTSLLAQDRSPAVGSNHEVSAYLQSPARGLRPYPNHLPGILNEIGRFGRHAQVKMRIMRCLLREEIQEVPLRYESNKLAAGREMSEVRERNRPVSNIRAKFVRFLVGQLQKLFEQPKLVQHFEGGGVNRVTAEVPEKIAVFFQDNHIDASAHEQ
jgi:hypothetical protein